MRGARVPAAALLLLRFALPVCLIAASCVAAVGLFRNVDRTTTPAASQQAPSLRLGSGSPETAPPPALTPTPAPTASPNRAAPVAAAEPVTASVEVFNASGVSGLAGRTAEALRLRGIHVASIGNLDPAPAPVAAMAVFYPPGIRGQAQTLARVSGAGTIAPAPTGLASPGTLVLVLTDARSAAVAALTSYVP